MPAETNLTANVSESELEEAKIAAVRAGKSLREWAGGVIRDRLAQIAMKAAKKKNP